MNWLRGWAKLAIFIGGIALSWVVVLALVWAILMVSTASGENFPTYPQKRTCKFGPCPKKCGYGDLPKCGTKPNWVHGIRSNDGGIR